MFAPPTRRLRRRLLAVVTAAPVLATAAGCGVLRKIATAIDNPALVACRETVSPAGERSSHGVRWVRPDDASDRQTLDDWCQGVGPVVVALHPAGSPADSGSDDIVVVSWNVNVGAADVAGLVRQLRAGRLTDGRPVEHFVLLLQEAYRHGGLVPHELPAGARAASALRPPPEHRERIDIVRLSAALGLALYYVPSMRNGDPDETQEDRGNAILSTYPLSDLSAIELPFERQRRVALEATVQARRPTGEPWTLRVMNVHLENRAPARRLWLFSSASRLRQARALLRGMTHDRPAVLGGDLNTWYGFDDPVYQEMAATMTRTPVDRRPTFLGLLRLDHLLFRLADGWEARTKRLDRFGSDHNALLATIRLGH